MRILILNSDYPLFLRDLYGGHPGLAAAPYVAQMQARNDSLFGVADFYSRNFHRHGHDAIEIHANNDVMQQAWAREHGMAVSGAAAVAAPAPQSAGRRAIKNLLRPFLGPLRQRIVRGGIAKSQATILRAQIEAFAPDMILNQEMDFIRSDFLNSVRRPSCIIIGQIAAALPRADDFRAYDLVISSLPNFVRWFHARGINAQLNRLAFDPIVLEKMGPPPARDIAVSFVGSLSPEHADRITLLERVAAAVPLKIWGNGMERLPRTSPLHAIYQGQAWGRDMFDILRRSRITLNHHIDLAGNYANNMRLYEATGSGAMLLTDAKENLAEIFAPGREVATYRTPEECAAQVYHRLAHDEERAAIAEAGQQRTLADHTYAKRTAEILELAVGLTGRAP